MACLSLYIFSSSYINIRLGGEVIAIEKEEVCKYGCSKI